MRLEFCYDTSTLEYMDIRISKGVGFNGEALHYNSSSAGLLLAEQKE